MDRIVTGRSMKKVDAYTIEQIGIPSLVLMENAANAMCRFIVSKAVEYDKILCVCGTGNNGADGMALARMLTNKGYQADVLVVGNIEKATNEFIVQMDIAKKCGVKVNLIKEANNTVKNNTNNLMSGTDKEEISYYKIDQEIWNKYNYIVDAIFGIGIAREVSGIHQKTVETINLAKKNRGKNITVIAADIPSGLNADTGKIMGEAVNADYTITFGALKTGLKLYQGKDVAGEIVVADIGFPEVAYRTLDKEECFEVINDMDMKSVTRRNSHSNKGTYGKVLIVAGSKEIYGAAYLSAMAALRMGCGLVRILTHENNRDLLYKMIPEAMITTFGDDGIIEDKLDDMVSWANVVAVGPGIGVNHKSKKIVGDLMKLTKEKNKYLIIDADGLNCIAEEKELCKLYHEKTVITPHIGEASRLIKVDSGEIAGNIVEIGKKYAKDNSITVVLKDSTSVILGVESLSNKCDNKICISVSGNAGMATAGSGDTLTGIIAGTLSGGISLRGFQNNIKNDTDRIYYACALATFIHGKAGELASERCGQVSMTATDILDAISGVLTS